MSADLPLAFSEAQLNAVFRHSPAAVVISRWADRCVIDVNDAFTELFGWSRDEAIGRSAADLLRVDPEVSFELRGRLEKRAELRDHPVTVFTRAGEQRELVVGVDMIDLGGERRAVSTFVDVTDRRLAQATANRLAAIVESSDDAIISKDLLGVVTTWNRAAERIFGYSAAEMIGASIMRIVPDDRTDEESLILERVRQGVGVTNLETRRLRKDGTPISVSITTSPIRSATGTIVGVSKIARDVSELRDTEAARRTSEASYRVLFDVSPVGMLIADAQGCCRQANPAMHRLLGYAQDDLVGRALATVLAGPNEEQVAEVFASIEARADHRAEWRLLHQNGTVVVADVLATPMPDAAALLIFHDITERNRIEGRFRRLVESNAQGVAFWHGRVITRANDAFLNIVGCTREELEAGKIDLVAMTPPEFAAADERAGAALAQAGVCSPYEKGLTLPDGSHRPVLVGGATFADDPTQGVCFVVDLTERKKLEQQFLRAQRMESVGTLAGGIAHDLNNVLAPILLSIGLLKAEVAEPRLQELLQTVQDSAQRGADLIQQVLLFARGVDGRRAIVNPARVLRDVMKVACDTLPRSLEVRCDAPADLWMVSADATQMHQVLLNLIVNARDAMPEGGQLRITAENTVLDETYAAMNVDARTGPYVVFTVADDGPGIPPDIRDRVFEPFFTTKAVGVGTGLGLSTTLAIVKSHGGFIHLYSEVGQGSKFKVFWPANASEDAAREVALERTELPRGRGEYVLVVDDEQAIRTIARATLERFGYRVFSAANGAEAVALYARHAGTISVVLTDMSMPIMDGPATIIAIRALDPAARIIASSGLASNDGVAKAVGAGVRDVVPKPYTAELLLRTIRAVIDRSEDSGSQE